MDGRTTTQPLPAADTGAMHAIVTDAYLAHGPALVRFLRSLTRDEAVAEDLAQEAFLRLAREIANGRTPDCLAAWLFRVGRNLATSRGRRVTVAARHAGLLPRPSGLEAPDALAIREEQARVMWAAMSRLPDDHREALLLAAEGYRGPEIAERLHRTPLATRALLCRVRGRLRGQLLAAGLEP